MADMGEPLYGKWSPTGYKDSAETWLSTANLMARINFANALATGQVPGVKVDQRDSLSPGKGRRGHRSRTAASRPVAANHGGDRKGLAGQTAEPGLIAALVIGSPDFQRR